MKKQFILSMLRICAIVLLFITGISAMAAGYSFIVEPSGKEVGISTDYLRPTAPFKNYLVPGIVLFAVIGILSVITAILSIKKVPYYYLIILMLGCIYVGWIAIQLTMVTTFHPFHAIVGFIGIILIAAGVLLSINQRYKALSLH